MFYGLYKNPSAMYVYRTEADAPNSMSSVQGALLQYELESKKIGELIEKFGR
jgi:hypothetical protein